MTTTLTTPPTTFSQAAFDQFLQSRNEPDWLLAQRREYWRLFNELDFPARNGEEWLRTDIRGFRFEKFLMPRETAAEVDAPPALLSEGVDLAGRTIAIDSRITRVEADADLAKRGVLFGSLDELVAQHSERIRPYLMTKAVNPAYDKFAAAHAALWSGGTLLFVPRGVTLEKPLHAYSVMTDGGVDFGHTLVVLEDGAEATLLCETASTSPEGGGLHCGATELILAPNSRLRFVHLQHWGNRVWHFAHQKAVLDRDASLQWTIGALGAKLAKVNQHVALAGPGAECQVNGTMFTHDAQHLSYHTLQHHQAPSCRSDFLYKAALQDRSRTVWRGMTKVDRAAQKTNGYQRNDNLILSDHARADSIPGLEIEADDVRCTHGSTTGRVEEELIFYAQARGYTRAEATRLIVAGFFQQVFDRIPIESVREALGRAISRRVREIE